jgi:broad specificity phosphatase PhoE
MTMKTSITRITEGQKKQYLRFVEDAAERALKETGLDKDGLQKLIENGNEFQARIVTAVRELSGYKPKGIIEQTKRLRELFPGIGYADEELSEQDFPSNAEGWFAIPRWEKIAPTYGEAVQKVLDLIKQTRNGAFYNCREGQLGPQYLRQSMNTSKAFQKLGDEQKDHDILVVSAQFGLRYRGHSVRWACRVMNDSEFGLGAFAIGIMILTHPERLQHYDDLWINCAGDEFSPNAVCGFSESPCFEFYHDKVKFYSCWFDFASGRHGPASGFLSQ